MENANDAYLSLFYLHQNSSGRKDTEEIGTDNISAPLIISDNISARQLFTKRLYIIPCNFTNSRPVMPEWVKQRLLSHWPQRNTVVNSNQFWSVRARTNLERVNLLPDSLERSGAGPGPLLRRLVLLLGALERESPASQLLLQLTPVTWAKRSQSRTQSACRKCQHFTFANSRRGINSIVGGEGGGGGRSADLCKKKNRNHAIASVHVGLVWNLQDCLGLSIPTYKTYVTKFLYWWPNVRSISWPRKWRQKTWLVELLRRMYILT